MTSRIKHCHMSQNSLERRQIHSQDKATMHTASQGASSKVRGAGPTPRFTLRRLPLGVVNHVHLRDVRSKDLDLGPTTTQVNQHPAQKEIRQALRHTRPRFPVTTLLRAGLLPSAPYTHPTYGTNRSSFTESHGRLASDPHVHN